MKNAVFKSVKPVYKPINYIDPSHLLRSLQMAGNTNLVRFLKGLLPEERLNTIKKNYMIGGTKDGRVIFWQVDKNNMIRTGKVMQYDATTGKRVRGEYDQINWVHSMLKLQDYNLKQCLFGEHLIKSVPGDVVVLVESEKTAILVSAFFNDATGVATGGCGNLNPSICKCLTGRDVLIIPDNDKVDVWKQKAGAIGGCCRRLILWDVMKWSANKPGDDIGDVIITALKDKPFPVELDEYLQSGDGFFDSQGNRLPSNDPLFW